MSVAPGSILEVTDETYDHVVLGSPVPVLLGFGNTRWCGPWQSLEPHLRVVAERLGNRIRVCAVNPDSHWRITAGYQVFSYPTLILLCREGTEWREVTRVVGPQTARELLALVGPVVGGEA